MSTREEMMDTLGVVGQRAFDWLSDTFPKFGNALYGSVRDIERFRGMQAPSAFRRNYEKRDGNMRIVPISPLDWEPQNREHLFHYPRYETHNDYVIDPHHPLGKRPERIQMGKGFEEWLINDYVHGNVRVNPATVGCSGGGPCVPRGVYGYLQGNKSFNQVVKDLQISQYRMPYGVPSVYNPVEGTHTQAVDDYLDRLNVDWVDHQSSDVHHATRHKDFRNIISKPGDTLISIGKDKGFDNSGSAESHVMLYRDGIPVGTSRSETYPPHSYGYLKNYAVPREGGLQIPKNVHQDDSIFGPVIPRMMEQLEFQRQYESDGSLPYFYDMDAGEGFTKSSFLRNYRLDGSLGPPYMQLDRYNRAQNRSR